MPHETSSRSGDCCYHNTTNCLFHAFISLNTLRKVTVCFSNSVKMKMLRRKLIAISLFGISVPPLSAQRVLITVRSGSIQWTCFDDDTIENCCSSIQTAGQETSVAVPSITSCTAHLATVPIFSGESLQIPARYSLITLEPPAISGQPKKQFLWERSKEQTKLQTIDPATSPYLISAELSDSLSIRSNLSSSGGMHRQLHHSLVIPDDYRVCYIFLTVPDGMFVDLDDAFEASSGATIRVHSAGVCDIEQPAFVSGQHSLVFEVRDGGKDIKFASKLHLRYPDPSPSKEQFIYLPEPELLCMHQSGFLVGAARQQDMEMVWVAAGNDHDYELVMFITVLVCLVGVGWMMADLSYVARWDD